jgi:hypothetical protein
MAWIGWLRAIETLGDLVDVGRKFRQATSAAGSGRKGTDLARSAESGALSGALGQMETRLTGVLVAALKEAFDRDRARMDLEREHVEAERRRAEESLRLEIQRQQAERDFAERRLTLGAALALWITSAALAAWLPGMRETGARVPLGLGWAALIGAIAIASAGRARLAAVGLIGGFGLVALSLVLAL